MMTNWETNRPAIKADVSSVEATALAAATEISSKSTSHLVVTANMTSAVWNTVDTHEVFTVSGAVRARMWIICRDTLTDAANLATIRFGIADWVIAFIGETPAAGKDGVTINAGEFWFDTSGSSIYVDPAAGILDLMVIDSDIGYRIVGEALTGGELEFHCVWEALEEGATVVAGAGGSL